MAKQVRVRRDTLSTLNGVVPADGEIAYNLTDDRLHMGNGTKSGGVPHANYIDVQKSKFSYAVDSGAANAYVVTLTYAPDSLAAPLEIIFKASNTNTGASTINVNGLGVKNIYKYTAGALGALAANDIIAGGIYRIVYDGTQWQLQTYTNAGLLTVKQGDLATSTGTISVSGTEGSLTAVTLPGGEYGFFPQTRNGTLSGGGLVGGVVMHNNTSSFLTRVSGIAYDQSVSNATYSCQMQQRYVTSSPPFSDARYGGEAAGFFFAIVNPAGEIVSHYFADVPPWAYNGPTNIRADHVCTITGKKFRKAMKPRSFEEIMDGAKIDYEMQEITQAIKNADMDLIPNPFGDVPPGHTVVLLDPTDDRIARMIEYQNAGGSQEILDQIQRGYIQINNDKIDRKGLMKSGFELHRLKFKYSGKGN